MNFEIAEEARMLYYQRRQNDLMKCREALQSQDFKFLRKVGHDLKGNACTFGYPPLADFGETLELAAMAGNIENAASAIEFIDDYLKKN